jgi:hypothetical protein
MSPSLAVLVPGPALLATAAIMFGAVSCGGDESAAQNVERTTSWRLLEQSQDGRTLTVAYDIGDPACQRLSRVERSESATAVRLKVILDLNNEQPCGDIGRVRVTKVVLSEPLGERELVGGAKREN